MKPAGAAKDRLCHMGSSLQRIKVIAGISLVIVGALGVLLPVVPGVPIILAGVALVGADHPIVRPINGWLQRWLKRRKKDAAK